MNTSSKPESYPAPVLDSASDRESAVGLGGSLWLLVALAVLAGVQAYTILASPAERDMGHLQKIMYVHVPAAWMTFLAFFVVLVFSVLYLFRRRESDDLIAASAAEVGAVFNGLTLLLGMIWGRPAWGVWWVWDARLTSTLVLFLIFVGYLALRAFVEDHGQRARWSAAVGMIGAINVPIVYMSVTWWRTLHQPPSSPATLDPAYTMGLRLNAIAFLFVMVWLIHRRYRISSLERRAERLAEAAAMGGRA
ncbi:MAG TPA: cytochrome c biogenesis protein CcsA [Gemmatimonadaceae bacterium]|nr:cytochrome c biogenesis protein CcsA [Gemmatimonadaceae bacterium]